MGIVTRMEQRASVENPSTSLANPAEWLVDLVGGGASAAGPTVNESSALTFSAFFSCVRAIAEDLSKLPMGVFERTRDARRPAPTHRLAPLIQYEPNREADLDPIAFRESLTAQALMRRHGAAEIEYDNANRIVALWPIPAPRIRSIRVDGKRYYGVRTDDGTEHMLLPDQVLWIRGFGADPWDGESLLDRAKEAIGLGLAMQKFGGGYFANGARPAGLIKYTKVLSESAQERLRRSWESVHRGLDRSHRVAILDEGMDYQSIGFNPTESQLLEARTFQIDEVARFFRMPPHKVMELTRSTFSNIEHQELEYVRDTLMPWAIRWEQQANRKLFSPKDQRRFYVKISFNAQLRADTSTRGEFYNKGLTSGWLQINDVRALEDMNPVAGGDVNLVPLNMIPLDSAFATPSPAGGAQGQLASRSAGEQRLKEFRQQRSITHRHRLQRAFVPVYEREARRLVDIEAATIRKLARQHLGERAAADFNDALKSFYKDFEATVRERYGTANGEYGQALYVAIADELGLPDATPPANFSDFSRSFTEAMAARHVRFSQDSVAKLLSEADPSALADAVDERMGQWQQGGPAGTTRASKIASLETVRAGGAYALAAYAANSVVDIIWRSVGESCPYCTDLDGTVAGIERGFAQPGDKLQGGEGEPPIEVSQIMRHPPAHGGCDCLIAAA